MMLDSGECDTVTVEDVKRRIREGYAETAFLELRCCRQPIH